MKKHYIALWALLAATFAFFAVASAFDSPSIGGHKFKSSGIADALFAVPEPEPCEIPAIGDSATATATRPAFPAPLDTAAQTKHYKRNTKHQGLGKRHAD